MIYKPGTLIGAAESIVLQMTCMEDVDECIVLHAGWMYQQRLIQEEDPHEGPVGDIRVSCCVFSIFVKLVSDMLQNYATIIFTLNDLHGLEQIH